MALRAIYILFEIPVFFDSPCTHTQYTSTIPYIGRNTHKGYQDNKIIDSKVAAMYTVNLQRRYLYGHAFVLFKSSKSGQK